MAKQGALPRPVMPATGEVWNPKKDNSELVSVRVMETFTHRGGQPMVLWCEATDMPPADHTGTAIDWLRLNAIKNSDDLTFFWMNYTLAGK